MREARPDGAECGGCESFRGKAGWIAAPARDKFATGPEIFVLEVTQFHYSALRSQFRFSSLQDPLNQISSF